MEDQKQLEEDCFIGNPSVDSYSLRQLRDANFTTLTTSFRLDAEERIKRLSRLEDAKLTDRILERLIDRKGLRLRTESGMISAMNEGPADLTTKTTLQNVVDISGADEVKIDAGHTTNSQQGQKNILEVDEFFARPIQIFESPILLGNDLDTFLRVWDLYTLNPAVRAKLRNYAYIRGNLHVKVAITGTPFHYGKLLLSYQPYDRFNETITSYLVSLTYNNDCRINFMSYLSQAHGATTLDMKDNQPIVIDCPFISTKPMHRLFNNTAAAISDVTSYTDLYNAGALYMMMLNTPDSVSDANSNLSIYVYAWMTEVELGTSSASIVGITTESGKIDEYKTGPVEEISTKLAEISQALVSVPEISPYAYASKMLFSNIAKFASLYGFSKPPVDQKPMFVKNNPYQNGAHCIGYDTSYKISLDPKQELTIDPRVSGTDRDEMMISYICSLEAYFTRFTWADTNVSMAPIWSCLVTPWMCSIATHGAPARKFIQPTPLAFAAQPFSFWRGDIDYRFDFVASAFHRGKVAIMYEPNIFQSTLIEANLSINKQFLAIVDLQETQSVTVRVKWAASRAWLKVGVGSDYENITSLLPLDPGYFNGFISVVPITMLTSPQEKDIDVNVWVSSKNMKFNFLNEDNLPAERKIFTESGNLHPIPVDVIDLNKSTASMDAVDQEHFGENPISFRLLLKRYAPTANASVTTSAGSYHTVRWIMNNIPAMKAAYSTAPVSNPIINLFDYLRYAYLGVRGGVRRRFHIVQSMGQNFNNVVYVNNYGPSNYVADSVTDSTTYVTASALKGSVHFIMINNGGIEYELPFYSNNLFVFSFSNTLDGGQNDTDDDMETEWVRRHEVTMYLPGGSTLFNASGDIASGEDFSLFRFCGAPYYTHT